MKRLHKFVITSFVGPLVLTFFIVMFLLLMQFLWKYIDDLVGKGLDPNVILELLLYASAGLVPMALPLGILLASIMTFGNLGENYELIALKSAGISLQRIMFPLMLFVFFICIAAFFFSNNVIPYTNLKMGTLMYDVQRQRPELQIKEGKFYNGIDGYSIRIADKNKKTNLLKNIMIYDHTDKAGNLKVTTADSGYMKITTDEKHLILTLYNGYSYEEIKKKRQKIKTYPHRRNKFEKEILSIELIGFGLNRTDESLFKNNYQMLNLNQLNDAIDSLSIDYSKDRTDLSNRILTNNLFKTGITKKEKKDNTPQNRYDVKNTGLGEAGYDSLFLNLNYNEKRKAVRNALNYARSAHNQIASSEQYLLTKRKLLKKHFVEWHRKFALSFACFIFFFIGAPLGAIIRKGGLGMPVVISVLFFILYYVISLTGEKFAKENVLLPWEGMWLSSFILLPLGAFLTYKAARDSVIMNADMYVNFFKKLFTQKKIADLLNENPDSQQ